MIKIESINDKHLSDKRLIVEGNEKLLSLRTLIHAGRNSLTDVLAEEDITEIEKEAISNEINTANEILKELKILDHEI